MRFALSIILFLPLLETDLLRVTVAGVSLTPDAVKWLRDTTFNKHIWFQFMQREGPVLDCDVTLKQVCCSMPPSSGIHIHFLVPSL